MSVVLDASVAATFFLPDEQSELSRAARQTIISRGALAPMIFWYEIRNILLSNERRLRIDAALADSSLHQLGRMPIALHDVGSDDVIGLARAYRFSVYDAAYLALARRENVPLLTLDKALASAAKQEGVSLGR